MRLAEGDSLTNAYLLGAQKEYTITFREKSYALNKVKLAKRDTKGVRPRL
jgi:DNA gyrase subunit A